MTSIAELEARAAKAKEHMDRLAAKAKRDFQRHQKSLERAREIEQRRLHALAKEASAKDTLTSLRERLERVAKRLKGEDGSLPIACRLHLLDMSLAGHKPATMELIVPAASVFRPVVSSGYARSYIGSAGAMAAEW